MNAPRECCPTPPQPSEPCSRPAAILPEVRRRPLEHDDPSGCLDAPPIQQSRIRGGKYCRSLQSQLLRSFTVSSWIMVVFLLWAVSLGVVAAGSEDIVLEHDIKGRDRNVEMAQARDVEFHLDYDLHRRSTSATKTDDLPSSIVAPTGTAATASATSTGIASDSGDDDTTIPSPFDSVSLTTNFTATSCPAFFQTFLKDPIFTACLPLSMLLQTSDSFFSITEKGSLATTKVLDSTCNVANVTECQETMEKYGWMIRQDIHCGADYKAGNPIVQQAYDGFIAYNIVYTAGCQKSDSGSYCYVDAITNTASPSDSYIYYLPLGLSLPGGSRPSCNTCLTTTMAAFDTVAGNATQPLSKTYVPAAEQINLGCGPGFVNTTVQPLSSHALRIPPLSPSILLASIVALALVGQHFL